jgi:hypothetical protein
MHALKLHKPYFLILNYTRFAESVSFRARIYVESVPPEPRGIRSTVTLVIPGGVNLRTKLRPLEAYAPVSAFQETLLPSTAELTRLTGSNSLPPPIVLAAWTAQSKQFRHQNPARAKAQLQEQPTKSLSMTVYKILRVSRPVYTGGLREW